MHMFTAHVTGIGYLLATPSKVTLQGFEDCLLHTRNYKHLSYAQHSYICMHIHTSRLYSRLLYTIKHSGGETFPVHQQYTLHRENFCGMPLTAYFTVLIYKAGKFSVVKCLQLSKICKNRESFPWNILSCMAVQNTNYSKLIKLFILHILHTYAKLIIENFDNIAPKDA